MIVDLISYTKDADALCGAIGSTCTTDTSSSHILGIEELNPYNERLLSRIMDSGHMSVVEHAVYTFSISGVSRALTHQLVRHRMASYTQQSQRYVGSDIDYVTPPSVKAEGARIQKVYDDAMKIIWDMYHDMCELVPVEDARYLLPNGATTNITVTMNARELLHFFSLRCCERAQWEIREMANMMLVECKNVSPVIFAKAGPPCSYGKCPEGKRTCGNPKGVKE